MTGFDEILEKSSEYKAICSSIQNKKLPMGIVGLGAVHKAHYISSLCKKLGKKALIICDSESSATKLAQDLNAFSQKALVYPERVFHFRSDDVCSREYEQRRLGVLGRIIEDDFDCVLCCLEAASQFTISPSQLKKCTVVLKIGQEVSTSTVLSALVSAGYTRCDSVDGIGQFSLRGGILDFFPADRNEPVRVEFWGDEIDNLSAFDIETQRRTTQIKEVKITPSTEVVFDSKEEFCKKLESLSKTLKGKGSQNTKRIISEDIEKINGGVDLSCFDKYISLAYEENTTLFDYFTDELLFVSETSGIKNNFHSFTKLMAEDLKMLFEEGVLGVGLDKYNLSWHEVIEKYEQQNAIYIDNLARGSFDTPVKELVSINAGSTALWDGTLSYLCEDLEAALRNGYRCVVMAGTEKNAKELVFELESQNIACAFYNEAPEKFSKKIVCVIPGALSSGFEYPLLKFKLFSYSRGVLTSVKKKTRKKNTTGKGLLNIDEIVKGDYVVHAAYGIGIFDGIQTITVDGKIKDFIKIKFKGSDVLYLPVTQLDLLSKYISPKDNDKPIKLNKLGTDDWNKTKRKVKAAVKDIAAELTKIYAQRLNSKGFAFSPDLDMQSDFERRFEYDETEDQLCAINEIKKDMERPCPMDRLLCGDVGFGKTEVALRAAFKCIADGKQCAILVPTTILAFQHYQTIKKRFDGFPIEIEMMSRFRTVTQRNKIKKGLKRGSIDLVVGTHSIIASSVEFKDLGLLIVDEEQRFGVAQKEKLKERFPLVDVLTLSATPIPRTLNMAMSGIRDMSVLEIPPLDRHPVQTYVMAYDMEVLAEAMQRELRRGGQVYYLHNRTEDIDLTAGRIQKYLPEARIATAHGKMTEEQLSEVWRQLLEGEIDILVCTTIIETGVDVPNANTLIIENADNLGLAQLHQIRGRVGRSSRRAFAYFTYTQSKALTDIASRRLSAIREFTQFGSGFQIAMRDLEIRGAGNILGAQQHGHMEAVGYDMYLQMLSDAIENEKSGGEETEKKECIIDISIDAHIPEAYISSTKNRISMYKRIASIQNQDDAFDVIDEFIDRFGEPPASVKGLVDVALLRNRAAKIGIYEIKQKKDSICVFVSDIKPIHITLMTKFLRRRAIIGSDGGKQYVTVKLMGKTPLETINEVIQIFEYQEPTIDKPTIIG